jgi:hypothetical protein
VGTKSNTYGQLKCRPPRWMFAHPMVLPFVLPPLSMDLGLLLISIGVVNLWKGRRG